MDYREKYLKYKNKYIELKNLIGGDKCNFKVGDKVRVTYNGNPYVTGVITELHFVQSRGQNYNICDAAAVKIDLLDVIQRYKIKEIQPILLAPAADIVLTHLPIEKLIEMYKIAKTDKERTYISQLEYDFYEQPIPRNIDFRSFRMVFSKAIGINLGNHLDRTDLEFPLLRGVQKLNMSYCNFITDAAFPHLTGSIKVLDMSNCNQYKITDAAFAYLKGIKTLKMNNCWQITSTAFAHLIGIQNLEMRNCRYIRDEAFANLKGIQTLDMTSCFHITPSSMNHLVGIKKLEMIDCNPETIAAAKALGLPVIDYY